jgi:uncharacterized membrane protein YqjE
VIKQSGDSGDKSVVSMVNGILDDSLKLVKQHLELFGIEIRSDYRKTKDAALYVASGIGLCLPGIILLCLMLVHLLHAMASPGATDPAVIPLWACYGIVGALFAIPGLLLTYAGVKKFQSFNPLPDETVQRLIESWDANGFVAGAPVEPLRGSGSGSRRATSVQATAEQSERLSENNN